MKNKYAEILSKVNNDQRNTSDSILIIDGLNCFLRAFTMINHINSEGHHIGGLTGFLKSIGYGIKQVDPTKVVIIFDGDGGSNSKRNLYPEYKANRHTSRMTNYSIFSTKEEENESIANQMERLIQYLQCLPVSIVCIDGIEADDVIGYLVGKLEKFNATKEVTIMSADQDFLQLVSNKTQVYSPTKKKLYKPQDVLEEYKVHPHNYCLYKIYMGDMGDNIPKVKGFGESKLFKLLPSIREEELLTLDESLKLIDPEDKWGCQVLNYKHQLEINRQLMDLKTIPISDANIEEIQAGFNSRFELNTHTFMTMYFNDALGESIPNAPSWLNQVFGSLNFPK
jgi:5'-3' exonuclease